MLHANNWRGIYCRCGFLLVNNAVVLKKLKSGDLQLFNFLYISAVFPEACRLESILRDGIQNALYQNITTCRPK
jgi:hypothetical protein